MNNYNRRETWSITLLTTGCLLLAKAKLDGRDKGGPAAAAGTAFHRAVEAFAKDPRQWRPPADVPEEISAGFEEYHLARLLGLMQFDPWPEYTVRVDTKGESTGRDAGRVAAFAGTIDLLWREDDGVHILDWKTGAHPVHFGADDPQMRAYAYLVFADIPAVETVWAHRCFVRFEDGWREEPLRFDRIEAAGLWNEIVERAERFQAAEESGVWPPSPCQDCAWCFIRDDCPEWRGSLILDPPGTLPQISNEPFQITENNALAVAKALRIVKARCSAVDKDLRAYLAAGNRIEDPDTGEVYALWPAKRDRVDAAQIVQTLRVAGIPPAEIFEAMKITKTGVEGLIKVHTPDRSPARKELREKAALCYVSEETMEMEWRKRTNA